MNNMGGKRMPDSNATNQEFAEHCRKLAARYSKWWMFGLFKDEVREFLDLASRFEWIDKNEKELKRLRDKIESAARISEC